MPPAAVLSLATVLAASTAAAPLTLDDALVEAARASSAIRAARSAADAADAGVRASYANVLPRLDVSAQVGHDFVGRRSREVSYAATVDLDTSEIVYGRRRLPVPATDVDAYALSATASWTLFDGGRGWNGIRRARSACTAAEHTWDEARLRIAFAVTQQFLEVVKTDEHLRVLSATVDRSRDLLARAEALFRAGRASRLDALTAESNLSADLIAWVQARIPSVRARAELAATLGRDDSAELTVVPPPALAAAELPGTEELLSSTELFEHARQRRPLLLAEAANLRAAELGVPIAHGRWSPVVTARASYAKEGGDFTGREGVFAQPARWYTATARLVAEWNVFEGGGTLADARRASATRAEARHRADLAAQQVAAEIAKARAAVLVQLEAARLARSSVAVARTTLELTRERLASGAATQLEIRDASLKLTQAELALANARVDHLIAASDLQRAVGPAP